MSCKLAMRFAELVDSEGCRLKRKCVGKTAIEISAQVGRRRVDVGWLGWVNFVSVRPGTMACMAEILKNEHAASEQLEKS